MSERDPGGRVFGLGLSRTGTRSLGRALEILGLSTVHYPHDRETHEALRGGVYELPALDRHDALVDIVAAPYYAQFDETYPGSKFILTVREREAWLRSVEAHFRRLERYWDETSPSFRAFTRFICAVVYGAHTFDRSRFAFVYNRHVAAVRDYFAGREEDLLVLDVSGGEGWEKLSPFLERPEPAVPFPHENRGTGPGDEERPVERRASEPVPSDDYPLAYHENLATSARGSATEVVPLVLDLLAPESVVDVGCGMGSWLAAVQEHGVDDVLGLDLHRGESETLEIPPERYLSHDLTGRLSLDRSFDLCLCLEVAEHLPAASAAGLVEDLVALAPVTLFAAAVPGQRGRGHVNERWPDYWTELFSEHGRIVVDAVRPEIWKNDRVDWWYRQNLLLFVDPDTLEANPRLRAARDATRPEQLALVHPALFERTAGERNECVQDLWERRTRDVRELIETHVPAGATYLLLDDGKLAGDPVAERRATLFGERHGVYGGPPPDGETAVRDLDRHRREGAGFVVVAWPAFWWLERYTELRRHLDAGARCVHRDEDAVVYDLRSDAS